MSHSSIRRALAAVCALAGVALVRRERRHAEPILPRVLFQTAQFPAANGVGFLINLAAYGQLFLLSLFLQHARGADALQTGIQLVPMLAVFSIGNLVSGRVSARWDVSAALLGGIALATAMSAAGLSFWRREGDVQSAATRHPSDRSGFHAVWTGAFPCFGLCGKRSRCRRPVPR